MLHSCASCNYAAAAPRRIFVPSSRTENFAMDFVSCLDWMRSCKLEDCGKDSVICLEDSRAYSMPQQRAFVRQKIFILYGNEQVLCRASLSTPLSWTSPWISVWVRFGVALFPNRVVISYHLLIRAEYSQSVFHATCDCTARISAVAWNTPSTRRAEACFVVQTVDTKYCDARKHF